MPTIKDTATIVPVHEKSGSYTITSGDEGAEVNFAISAAATATLPEISSVGDGFNVFLRNSASTSDTITVAVSGSDTVEGGSSISLEPEQSVWLRGDGTKWEALSKVNETTNSGKVVQIVNVHDGATATGTTTIPYDDSIPQNNEGDQYMSLTITPADSSNYLFIEVVASVTSTATTNPITAALFQDSISDALAAQARINNTNGTAGFINFNHYMSAGTTSPTTLKLRMGGANAGTTTFNGSSGRLLGGVMASSITITEIEA